MTRVDWTQERANQDQLSKFLLKQTPGDRAMLEYHFAQERKRVLGWQERAERAEAAVQQMIDTGRDLVDWVDRMQDDYETYGRKRDRDSGQPVPLFETCHVCGLDRSHCERNPHSGHLFKPRYAHKRAEAVPALRDSNPKPSDLTSDEES